MDNAFVREQFALDWHLPVMIFLRKLLDAAEMTQVVGLEGMGARLAGLAMFFVAIWLPVDITSARAETVEQLDWMSQMTVQASFGLQLARDQTGRGELLEALATLERVLAIHPEAKEAQLRHASLLCRIDDPDGATAEFSRLKERDFKKQVWTEAKAPCAVSGTR